MIVFYGCREMNICVLVVYSYNTSSPGQNPNRMVSPNEALNVFELEPMSAEPMNTTQIVPSLGFRTGFVFWKRLDVGLAF